MRAGRLVWVWVSAGVAMHRRCVAGSRRQRRRLRFRRMARWARGGGWAPLHRRRAGSCRRLMLRGRRGLVCAGRNIALTWRRRALLRRRRVRSDRAGLFPARTISGSRAGRCRCCGSLSPGRWLDISRCQGRRYRGISRGRFQSVFE